MNKINFSGFIDTSKYEVVLKIITDWLGSPKIKHRLYNEEIFFDDDTTSVYAFNPVIEGIAANEFMIQGNTKMDLRKTKMLFDRLWEVCQSLEVTYDLDYMEVDEKGNIIGEEYEYKRD